MLVAHKATRFFFAYPLPSEKVHGVIRLHLDLCLTLRVPSFIRIDGGGEFTATLIEHLCRWLKIQIDFDPTNPPRAKIM